MCNEDDTTSAIGTFEMPVLPADLAAYAPKMAEHYGWQSWSAIAIGDMIVVTKEDRQWLVN